MNISTIKGKVIEKDKVANNTYSIKIASLDNRVFDFKPGQFVTLILDNTTRRSYSIASLPSKPYIELIADTNRGGRGSMFFENVKVDDEIEFLFPLGNFFYTASDKPVHFFATGSGIVPFLSMIEYALTVENTKREMFLRSGFRHIEDIIGEGVLKMLDVRFENFKYSVNLTEPPEGYSGLTGRITQYIDQLDNTDIEVYICGSNQMVLDIKQRLIDKGVKPENIYHEMFY